MKKNDWKKKRKKRLAKRDQFVKVAEQLQADLWRIYATQNPAAVPGDDMQRLLDEYPPTE